MAHDGLNTDIQFLPGVGPKRAELLGKELGISTVGELLRLYPFRHIDKSTFVRIADARPDMAHIQIKATVMRVDLYGNPSASSPIQGHDNLKFNTVRRMSVWVSDGSAEMEMVFFKGIKWMYERLRPGTEFIFFGKPQTFNGRMNMVHPEVDPTTGKAVTGSIISPGSASGTMTGVYTSTERLKNGGITGKVMNRMMEAALTKCLGDVKESLPEYIMRQYGLTPIHFALRNIHFPKDVNALEKARYRLKFEELFYLQLSLLKQKYIRSREDNGIAMPKGPDNRKGRDRLHHLPGFRKRHYDRGLHQHGETQERRYNRQGDEQDDGGRADQMPGRRKGIASGIHHEAIRAHTHTFCTQEHPFPKGCECPGKGALQTEI